MMRDRRLPLLLVLALAVVLAACDPQTSSAPADGYDLAVEFEHVDNLVPGHAVRVADVVVGTVTAVELTDDLTAEVTMRVDDDLLVPEGSVAIIRKTSLLGEDFVALLFPEGVDPTSSAVLGDGDRLDIGVPIASVEEITERAIQVLGAVAADDLTSVVDSGLQIVDGREDQLRAIIDDVSTVTGTYAARTDDIGAVIDGLGDLGGDLAAGREELAAAVGTLEETVEIATTERDRVVSALGTLERLQTALDGSLLGDGQAEFEAMLAELGPTVDTLATDSDSLSQLLDDVAFFADTIQRSVTDEGELNLYILGTLTIGSNPIDLGGLISLLEPPS